jgi:DNA replication and repair protein RecF
LNLFLKSISLYQFKNYYQQEFQFTENIVGICGRNGVGKTNLLDAVHYLCFTKSYFTRDSLATQYGQQGFRIEGRMTVQDKKEKPVCIFRETGKKEFSVDDESYTKFSKHIGRYPCVVIAPDDIQIIIGNSEDRRKFIDTLLAQVDNNYLQSLITYTKILQQRNSFLRSYSDGFANRDLTVLDALDKQLSKEGNFIFEQRRDFLLGFLPVVKKLYNEIAKQYEPVGLFYESELQSAPLDELLKNNRNKDLIIQRTSVGIHRDDLVFNLGEQPFKGIASQGQRKSLLFALKLAEMEALEQEKKKSPILLLDDVFEKLDEERINNLLMEVTKENDGQIFITDTSCSRLKTQLEKLEKPFQLIEL